MEASQGGELRGDEIRTRQ